MRRHPAGIEARSSARPMTLTGVLPTLRPAWGPNFGHTNCTVVNPAPATSGVRAT
jgi:hypothetical protein